MTARRGTHTVYSILGGHGGRVSVHVDCHNNTISPDRDCLILEIADCHGRCSWSFESGGLHAHPTDGCGALQFLAAVGPESIGWGGYRHVRLPAEATMTWDAEGHPVMHWVTP